MGMLSRTSLWATKHCADSYSSLASTYHGVMVGAMGLYFSAPVKVLVVGLGGGGLPNYLHATFPLSNIHVVELDPAIVRVATDQFSFHLDDRLTVSTRDGIEFINETKEHFSLIMLDVDSKRHLQWDVLPSSSLPRACIPCLHGQSFRGGRHS